ncbi:MAG: hypothetical protein E8D41_04270 [Nitrospira sp.]|nr:MAG: hypothetical protein E8D41_04270 [Nitrospira sp.]
MYDTKYNFHHAKSHRAWTGAEDSKELECSRYQHGKTTAEVLACIEQDSAETMPTLIERTMHGNNVLGRRWEERLAV